MSRLPYLPAVALVFACALTAHAAEPTALELQSRIDNLKAQLARLESDAPRALPSQVVDDTVARVLRDADKRSQLLDMEGITAGYDQGHFVIRSADGNYVLIPQLVMQFRSTTNYREDAKNGGDDIQNGFEIRRMKLIFSGNAISPDLTYRFQWETNRTSGAPFLQDAFIKYRFADDWAFRAGQMWDIQNHEDTMLEPMLLTCDRSLVDFLIGGGQAERVQGASLMYEPVGALRGELLFHDGYNSDNTSWPDSLGGTAYLPGDLDFGVSGRFEFFASGSKKNYDDFTALGTKENLLAFGAGFSYSQAGSNDVVFHTIDVQWEGPSGWALFAEYVGAWRSFGVGGAFSDAELYDWGFLAQGSYLMNDRWEAFARFDYTSLDEDGQAADGEDQYYEVTGGVNYYMSGHKARVTVDLTWLPNGAPSDATGLGILASEEDQFVLRGQFQLIL